MSHVLLLTLVFPPDGVSTADLVGSLALDLRDRGHRVTVLTTTPHYNRDETALARQPLEAIWGPLLQRSSFEGIPVYHVKVPRKTRSVPKRLLAWAIFHVVSTVVAIRTPRRASLIVAPSPPLTIGVNAWVIGRLKRCPFIYNVQEIYPDVAIELRAVENRAVIAGLRWLERFVYRRARYITVIGPGMQRNLIEKGVPPSKLALIPNTVDVAACVPSPAPNEFTRTHALHPGFVVSYAGNMGPTMGLDAVLEAADQLRDRDDVIFLLVGGGSLVDDIGAAIDARSLRNVRQVPYQPSAVVPQIYGASDVSLVLQARGTGSHVLPSKVYRIMAYGKPLIACADPGSDLAQLVMDAGCGIVVPAGDSTALARAIRSARDNRVEWQRKGLAGRDYVERHYSRAESSGRYDRLIRAMAP
jgi:colanic acid biosynthesis glycosyl transferase WcaI